MGVVLGILQPCWENLLLFPFRDEKVKLTELNNLPTFLASGRAKLELKWSEFRNHTVTHYPKLKILMKNIVCFSEVVRLV